MKGYVIKLAEYYAQQIIGRYGKIREEEAKLIADNVMTVLVDYEKIPRQEKKIGKRRETTDFEEHYASVVVKSVRRSAGEINKDENIIKVIPARKSGKQSSGGVFVLQRYGPWHMDKLPYIPPESEATIIFTRMPVEKVASTKKKNNRQENKVRKMLSNMDIKYTSRQEIEDKLDGYDDLQYWALKREFGLDGPKMRAWKPALDYITKKGYIAIIRKERNLLRTLLDANYKDYKNAGKGYKIIKEDIANHLIKFQERIRG